MGIKEEIGALVIRNSAAVNSSFYMLEKIDGQFVQFFNAAMPHIMEEILPGWEYWNFLGGKGASFWPASWRYPEDKYAFFEIIILKDNKFWLNCLTGEDGELGIAFRFNPDLFGDRKANAQQLKQNFYFKNEAELQEHGFNQTVSNLYKRYGENFVIYHPFRLDVDVIANEYPDWTPKALMPFRACLEDIKVCFPIFNSFVLEIAGPNQGAPANPQA